MIRPLTTTTIRLTLGLLLVIGLFGPSVSQADITYSLVVTGDWTESIEQRIDAAMSEAVAVYNQYGSFNNHINVEYHPGVPTAEASYGSYLKFGGSIGTRVAMHEISHTLGVGTYWAWGNNLTNRKWTGTYGAQRIQEFDGNGSQITSDGVHFWPYGLNYDSEDSDTGRIRHVQMMAAFRADMWLLAIVQEPQAQVAQPGDSVTFTVGAANYSSLRWYKDGTALSDGRNVSGTTTATLLLTEIDEDDTGVYTCVAKSGSNSLSSRPARLSLHGLVGHWTFNDTLQDRVGFNHATAIGSPTYVEGVMDSAIDLDGSQDAVILPAGVADAEDMTVACWVNWDGSSQWQRIFDFGNNTSQNMFLTPRSGSNTLRFALKNGGDEERLETTQLSTHQWVHIAIVIEGDDATLFVDGEARDINRNISVKPIDFSPTVNYIGDSQYSADPFFNGQIDDFRIYNYALNADDIMSLLDGLPGSPSPADEGTGQPVNSCLTFNGGASGESSWQVYLGTDASVVETATPDSNECLGIRHQEQLITPTLQPNTTYAWRVDPRLDDGTVLQGNTWTFTTGSDAGVILSRFTSNPISLPNAVAGQAYDQSLASDIITTSTTRLSKLSGPQWIAVTEDGHVTGTPLAAGQTSCSVLISDANGLIDEAVITLVVDTHDIDSDLDPNLVACWTLDEAQGDSLVDSTGNHNATLLNADTSWRPLQSLPEKISYCLALDGDDDRAEVSGFKGILGQTSRTCSAWIKTSTGSGEIIAWGQNKDWTIKLNSSGKLLVEAGNGHATGSTVLTDGLWHHLAVTLANDGSPNINEALLYVDGQLESLSASSSQAVNTDAGQDVTLGSGFQGLLDEISIYDRVLAADEIAALASSSLKLYLPLDESDGVTAQDRSINQHLCYLVNGPTWQPDQGAVGGALSLDGEDDCIEVDYAGILSGQQPHLHRLD